MKNVIFIAPPAAGKGTQSSRLEEIGYDHISTGDMLREEIASGSELGKLIDSIISKGNFVSDEMVFELISNKLSSIDKPFILDGFPRTISQSEFLDNLLLKLNNTDYEVIYLDISSEEAMKRALGRLTCNKCGASYNKYYEALQPIQEGVCDKCGSVLETRGDDNEESFKVRFNNYITNTEPIKEFYEKKGRLHVVDATLDTEEITKQIKNICLDEHVMKKN
jgi:adenylate kinase